MSKISVEAFAPASMGNVGVGFDILGLAFNKPCDRVWAQLKDELGVTISSIEGDGGRLPLDAKKNTAGVAVDALLKKIDTHVGIDLKIKKGLPLGSGMGSSAASAVAAVVAVNALLGNPLPKGDLLSAALEGEALASGYHADNIAPSLLGGIVLITGTDSLRILRLPTPQNLYMALITPNCSVETAMARSVLPKEIPLKHMVMQTAAVAELVDALHRNDVEAMARVMEKDCVVEPVRAHLMPHFYEVRSAVKQAGALGLVISGAGPTLCAICDNEETSKRVAMTMEAVYDNVNIESVSYCTRVDEQGAHIL